MPSGPSPSPISTLFSLAPTQSAHVRASRLAHGCGAFSPPISTHFPCTRSPIHTYSWPPGLLPAHFHLRSPTGPSANSLPPFPLHTQHTSAHPRLLMPTGPSFHPFHCTRAVRTPLRIHARPCPPGLLPTHFHPSLAPTPPHTSAHPRLLMPTGPSFHPFHCTRTVRTPLRIHARSCPPGLLPTHFDPSLAPTPPHTSAHPRSLMPTGPSSHPFPPFLCTHTAAHVRASTLAHAQWAFSPPISTLALAPTLSAHVRATQLAPRAVSRLNEIPSIEDAFGKNITGNQGCQKKAITGNQGCSVGKLENYPYIDYHRL